MTEEREKYLLEQIRTIRISVEIATAIIFLWAIIRAFSWVWTNLLAA